MRAGKLRHRIEIQANTPTQGDLGAPVDAWATAWRRWASFEQLEGKRLELARQTRAEATYRAEMRYLEGVTTAHRVVWKGRTFSIDAVITPAETPDETHLLLHELK